MAKKNIAGITAKLGLDVSGVTSALNEIEKKSKKLASEMKEVDSSLKLDPQSVVLAAQKQELLSEAISNTQKKLTELESVQKKTDNAFKNQSKWEEQYAPLKEAIDATKEKLKELQKQNETMRSDFESGKINSDQYQSYQNELEATKAKMKELQNQANELEASFKDGHITADEYRAYQREVENTKRELQNLQSEQNGTKKSTENLGKSAEKSGDNFKGAKKNIKSYEDAVKDLKSAMDDVAGDIKNVAAVAGGAVAAVGTAAVGAVGAAAEVGSGFEKSMSRVEAISGATGNDLERLRTAAETMGANTSKTASESADALSYMALAGWKTEEMLTGLEPILRASEAGEMDLATCSDLVTDSMSAMGVSVNDLSHYLDVVAAAQSNSNTNMQQLLEAFIECGGSAHNFGLNVEDLSTVLGVMANRGIKGTEAGTALNSIFVNMLGSTQKTAEAMDALGLSLYDNEGNMKDVTEVLKEMGDALASATDEQRNNLEAMLGGKTQITALQAMVNGLNGEYDDLSETLYDCDGALLKTAKTMQDNLTGNVTAMQSALEGLGIKVYDYLEEPLKSAVQSATKEISELSRSVTEGQLSEVIERLADKFGKLIEKAAAFAADEGIPALINALDWISRNGDNIIATVEGMGAAWGAWKIGTMVAHVNSLVKAIKDYKTAQEAATAAQIAANDAAKANIYVAVAAAAIGLATALGKLGASQLDSMAETLRERDALDEVTQAMLEQQDAIENRIGAFREESSEIDSKAEKERALWKEIQTLVDEEGNQIDQSGRLGDAINELNTLAGTNIQIIGGQIQGYQGLKTSIDDVIASQQRQAKLSFLQDDYGEALVNIDEVTSKYEQALAEKNKWYEQINSLSGMIAEMDRTGIVPDSWAGSADDLRAAMDNANEEFTKATVQVNALYESMTGYQGIIDTYNTILTEEAEATNNGGKEAGGAFGEGFAEGAEGGTGEAENAASDVVGDAISAAREKAESEGKSVGEIAADALTAAMESGMKDSDLKKLVKQYVSDLKYEQAKLGADDSWLYDEEEKMISVLGEGSELYKEYMTTILNGRKKIADSAAKNSKSNEKTEAQKEAQAILDTMDSMYAQAVSEGKDIGEAASESIAYGVEKGLDDSKLKTAVDGFVKKADIGKALNHKDDDNWYYDQLEKIVDALGQGSELYDNFYLKLVEGRNKVADADEKANDKEAKSAKKKTEEIEKLQAKYQADFGSVFTKNVSNSRYGSKDSERIDTSKMEKIVAAKEKLSGYLTQLAAKGMPQSVIDELLTMDPIEAVEYARILLRSPTKFDSVKDLAERDKAASKKLAAASLGSSEDFSEAGKTAGANFANNLLSAVDNIIGNALPNLTGIASALGRTQNTAQTLNDKSASNNGSTDSTVTDTSKTNALLESIAILLNSSLGNGISVSFSPTIETSVTMDGETVAKGISQKQYEQKVRTST